MSRATSSFINLSHPLETFEASLNWIFSLYQYPVPGTGPEFGIPIKYEKHILDFFVISIVTFIFIQVRLNSETYIFLPLARAWKVYVPKSKKSDKSKSSDTDSIPVIAYKFCEQFWLFINHTISFTFGMYLLQQQPYVKNIFSLTAYNTPRDGLRYLWLGYSHEHKLLTPVFKAYYIWEISYWMHLAITEFYFYIAARNWTAYEKKRLMEVAEFARKANGEALKSGAKITKSDDGLKQRKGKNELSTGVKFVPAKPPAGRRKVKNDAMEILLHHVVTVALTAGSYYVNLTRMGHITLALFDVSDIVLSLAKVIKYVPSSPALITDTLFGIFMVSWVYTRHLYFMLRVMPSVYWDSLTYIEDKKFSGFTTGHFYSMTVHKIFIGLFVILELLMFYWFALIAKVAWKVVMGTGADDVRSDEEDEVEETK
ncbi:sphingosine N-acyltransferase lag1 [Nowakowskiella sp. JEL0078]|nr:sphingosine N-acyltransferase lag1 [Nowakowskiella sp. JEL0078]